MLYKQNDGKHKLFRCKNEMKASFRMIELNKIKFLM